MLERLNYLKKGSKEWLELRNKYIKTASRTPIIMGLSPYSNMEKLAKEIKFNIKPFYTKNMQLGNELEDKVRELANNYFNDTFMPNIGINNDFLASLDGINFYENIIIEIKVSEGIYESIKDGLTPDYCVWQVKHQMQVFWGSEIDDRKEAYVVAYSIENDDIAVSKPIFREDNDFSAIKNDWVKFEEFLSTYELPTIANIKDQKALSLAFELSEILAKKKELELKESELREELTSFVSAEKNVIGNLTISKTKGRDVIDYKTLIKNKGISKEELQKYTNKSEDILKFKFS
jgi:putative phage-type endonuclease